MGVDVTYDMNAPDVALKWVLADGTLRFAQDAYLKVESIVGGMKGRIEIGTPDAPILGNVTIEFADFGAIEDWSQLGRGLIVMGDLSIYGQETTSFVHAAQNPNVGDAQITLDAIPENWAVGGQLVVPGVRPTKAYFPYLKDGIDPTFAAQNELRTIIAIEGNVVTLDAPLAYDLHDQLQDGLTIPIGYLDRNIVLKSENTETSRRGHVMVMPMTTHEYTIAYAEFRDLGRTSQEQSVTDPKKDADGNVIPESVANPRARYALHFHKMGFETHATVKGVSVVGGLKWGIVNHSSNVDVMDSIAYDVRGAGFASEIGNEWGSFQNCLSVQSLGFGDLNHSPTRTGPQSRNGQSLNGDNDFGFNGSGFWLQGARVRLVGNEVYGAVAVGFNIQTIPFGTDHLGPHNEIYLH